MVSVNESMGSTPLANALAAGLNDISYGATCRFSNYIRMVLPLDGYVFYVRADLVDSAVASGLTCSEAISYTELDVPGSLHTSTETTQQEEQNVDISTVVFTTKAEIKEFHGTSQNHVWIGDFEGIKFAVNSRNSYYKQADLHHYVGATILPTITTQIIDDIDQLQPQRIVLSNSMPFFLALSSGPELYAWMKPPPINFYPAFLSPDNMVPPYATVHIDPASTEALQAGPMYSLNGSRDQHTKERVRLIFYGLRNDQIMDVLDYITQWSLIYDKMGIMNMPIVKDLHQMQPELGAMPIKKSVVLDVNYYQSSLRDISWQYILHCTVKISESW